MLGEDGWAIHDGLQNARKSVENMAPSLIVLVGDVMLDRYIYGYANNLNPRAPVPVLKETHREQGAGAAAHVARGLHSLQLEVALFGVVADDEAGGDVVDALEEVGISADGIVVLEDWRTTVKTRFIASRESLIENKQMMLRVDEEANSEIPEQVANILSTSASSRLVDAKGLVLSDYGKGAVNDETAKSLMAKAKEIGVPVICDPKLTGLHRTRGADAVIFESRGLELMRRRLFKATADEAAAELVEEHGWGALLVLGGQNGVDMYKQDGSHLHVGCSLPSPRQQIGLIDAAAVAVVVSHILNLSDLDMAHLVNAACECILQAEDAEHFAIDRRTLCTRLDEIAWSMQISQR